MNDKPKIVGSSKYADTSGAETFTAFEIAQVAVLLASKSNSGRPDDFFQEAFELLSRSAHYLRQRNAKKITDFMQISGVPFDTILKSNEKNNPNEEKLLPGVTTEQGLIKLIRRYYKSHSIHITDAAQKSITAKTGQTLTGIQDQTSENFICGKYLPPVVLSRIREWRQAQRSTNARKSK